MVCPSGSCSSSGGLASAASAKSSKAAVSEATSASSRRRSVTIRTRSSAVASSESSTSLIIAGPAAPSARERCSDRRASRHVSVFPWRDGCRRARASDTTLLGLVRHVTFVEGVWFDQAVRARVRRVHWCECCPAEMTGFIVVTSALQQFEANEVSLGCRELGASRRCCGEKPLGEPAPL